MDSTLRCNSLKCREVLNDRAVVTTCSHIFCVPCSEATGLSNSAGGPRICPACEAHLANPDDVVVTQLNPTEDYKTSVLSGLSPTIIMECAGRGLAFYSYQTTQEIIYQEFLAKSLTEKYTNLSGHMDKIIHDANSEIVHLREKMSAMQADQKGLEQKNHELMEAFKEKSRSQQQVQKLYQSLKAQVMASQVASAASDDAENAINTVASNRSINHVGNHSLRNRGPPFSADSLPINKNHHRNGSFGSGGDGRERAGSGLLGRTYSPQGLREMPSSHRTRLPRPLYGRLGTGDSNENDATRLSRVRGTARQPLHEIDTNALPNPFGSGYGMSAGLKMGRPAKFPISPQGSHSFRAGGGGSGNLR